MHNSNQKPVSVRPVRGILRGKIHRTMAVWPAITQGSSSLPDEQRLCDLQEVTSPGAALCPGAAGQAACREVCGSRLVPPGSGSGSDHGGCLLRGRAREPLLAALLGVPDARALFEFGRRLVEPVLIAAREDDVGPLTAGTPGYLESDARAAANHDDGLPG